MEEADMKVGCRIKIFAIARNVLKVIFYFIIELLRYVYIPAYNTFRLIIARCNAKERLLCSIVLAYHQIEKGIIMPERRMGFGRIKVAGLIKDLKKYIIKYGKTHEQIDNAVSVIVAYKEIYKNNNYDLGNGLNNDIDNLLNLFAEILPIEYEPINAEVFFKDNLSSFDIFASSRHSVRSFETGGGGGQILPILIKPYC
jgi:hypothetical protein